MTDSIKGFSEYELKIKAAGFRVHYSAHPDHGPEWVKQERQKYSSQGTWDREQEIVYEAGGGERIFAEVFSKWEEKILVDPRRGFQVPPQWKRIAGFDHGKANPTAALVGCVDYDGVIYLLSEYYQPGLSPREHRRHLRDLNGFDDAEVVWADPSIFYKSHPQSDGSFKAINDLYIEEGIFHLAAAPDNSEATGMERILKHWLDLDRREPTLKIVCPREYWDIPKPIYGVHNYGCPNLLWELRRARREELTAAQLVHKNPTERIVDKDNHLRDCLKYMALAMMEPTQQTPEQKANEAIKDIPKDDPTSRMIFWNKAYEDAKAKDTAPMIPMGNRGRYNLMRYNEWEKRKNGMWMRNLFKDPGEKG